MQNAKLFKLLVIFTLVGSLAAPLAGAGHTVVLVFDASGKLVSETPSRIRQGDEIQIKVKLTERDHRRKEEWLLDHFVGAIRGIDNALPETPPFDRLFGVTSDQLRSARKELCGAVRSILKAASHTPRRKSPSRFLASLGCRKDVDFSEPKSYVPQNFAALGDFKHRIEWSCLEPSELAVPHTSHRYTIPRNCSRVEFRITRVHLYAAIVDQWFEELQNEWSQLLETASLYSQEWEPLERQFSVCEPLIQNLEDGDPSNDPSKADVTRECQDPLAALKGHIQRYFVKLQESGWVAKWVWLTQGELYANPVSVGRLHRALSDAASRMETLIAEVEIQNRIVDNLEFSDIKKTRMATRELAQTMVRRDTQISTVAGLRARLTDLSSRVSDGELLHQGLLVTQEGTVRAAMRHHDAARDYVIQSVEPLREVDQDERVVVLVSNEQPETELSLNVEAERIETDPSLLARGLGVQGEASDARIEIDESIKGIAPSELRPVFRRARLQLRELASRSALPLFPLRRPMDDSPAFSTQEVAHRVDSQVPTRVRYTIQARPEGASQLQDVGGGEYRVNRRYHVRFKTGLMYSHREERRFTFSTDEDGAPMVSEQVSRAGIEGTFGIQIYPDNRDIRQNNRWYIPVGYLGFSVTNPSESFFAGFGWELYSGITILGGLNLGRDQELLWEDGMPPRTRTDWDQDYFYAFLVDPNVFTRLFGLADRN